MPKKSESGPGESAPPPPYNHPQSQGNHPPPHNSGYPPPQQQGYYPPPQQQGNYPPSQQQGHYPPPQQQGHYPPPQQPYYPPPPMQQMQTSNNVTIVNNAQGQHTVVVKHGVNHCMHCCISIFFPPWIIVWMILCCVHGC